MTQTSWADYIAPVSVWGLMQLSDPFYQMLAEQVAPLLGIESPLNLNVAEVGDEDFVPYVQRGTGRVFLLGDVMTEAAARGGLKPPQFPSPVATTLEAARAVLNKRVGLTPPAWHDEKRHRSNEDVPSPAMKRKSKPSLPVPVVSQATAAKGPWAVGIATIRSKPPVGRGKGRRATLVSGTYTVKGTTATANIAKFSSLGDFLQNAARDDEWLFVVPPKGEGRPYDFLEALMAGDTETPWKAMTYAEYLRAMLDAAIEDEARWIGEEEKRQLEANIQTDSR